jgi:hypothetical protein
MWTTDTYGLTEGCELDDLAQGADKLLSIQTLLHILGQFVSPAIRMKVESGLPQIASRSTRFVEVGCRDVSVGTQFPRSGKNFLCHLVLKSLRIRIETASYNRHGS